MTARSTRNKILHQADRCIATAVKLQGHLKFMDELAEKQSPVINDMIPTLVFLIDELEKALTRLRGEL